ncbi:MAG: hypothetical protein L0312_32925 [Acidobacteria bacterium]|nr:hypothetical protein [Acidobacteriota bacterium]
MNIQTITMPKEKAREAFLHYRQAVKQKWTEADHALMRGYKVLAKGQAVLDLQDVMHKTGLDHLWRPKLAIGRADAPAIWARVYRDGRADFSMERWFNENATRRYVRLPAGTFATRDDTTDWVKAQTPSIPPQYRPKAALSNFHILWEAEWQAQPPRDPILLRRLSGMLFAVLASWDLTDLERAVLRGRL